MVTGLKCTSRLSQQEASALLRALMKQKPAVIYAAVSMQAAVLKRTAPIESKASLKLQIFSFLLCSSTDPHIKSENNLGILWHLKKMCSDSSQFQ